jgi:hypothetical protein
MKREGPWTGTYRIFGARTSPYSAEPHLRQWDGKAAPDTVLDAAGCLAGLCA